MPKPWSSPRITATGIEDDARATRLHEQNCRDGYDEPCIELSNRFNGREDDELEHVDWLIRACDEGHMNACVALSSERIRRAAPDTPTPLSLLRTACENGHAIGCTKLFESLLTWDDSEQERLSAASRACDAGHDWMCLQEARMQLENGDDPSSKEQAFETLQAECPTDHLGCVELARSLIQRADSEGASRMLQQMCFLGIFQACKEWAVLLKNREGAGGRPRAQALNDLYTIKTRSSDALPASRYLEHRRLCAEGYPVSCSIAWVSYTGVSGIALEFEGFHEAIRKSCDVGVWVDCWAIGKWSPRGSERRREALDKACEAGMSKACAVREISPFNGYPVSENGRAQAIRGVERRCLAGHLDSCDSIVSWYAYERGVWAFVPEPALAELYAKRGCELGDMYSCVLVTSNRIEEIGLSVMSEQEIERHARNMSRICREEDYSPACSWHGALFIESNPSIDEERGLQIWTDYCKSGRWDICRKLIKVYRGGTLVEANEEKAREIKAFLCAENPDAQCDD